MLYACLNPFCLSLVLLSIAALTVGIVVFLITNLLSCHPSATRARVQEKVVEYLLAIALIAVAISAGWLLLALIGGGTHAH